MTEPVRMTDSDVIIISTHSEESAEYKAAMSRLVRRMADHIDQIIARKVYDEIYGKTAQ